MSWKKKTRALCFAERKDGATFSIESYDKAAFTAAVLFTAIKTNTNEKSLDNFRKGRGNVLVATDVAARGLDIPGVAMVLIYDFPGAVEDYVHRIRRAGRAGKTGVATLYSPKKIRNRRESWYKLWKVRTKRCLQSYML